MSYRRQAQAELELRRRRRTGGDPFTLFQARYRYDPLAFVHDCLDFRGESGPAPYQDGILADLVQYGRVAVRGPHGIGKTALATWVVLWGSLTADDCKVPTTASAWRQLTKFLWPEIHKWAGRIKWDKVGRSPFTRDELLTLALKRGATCEAFAVASNNADLIEGAHARRIVYVYDEARSIPDTTWDATEGAFAGAGEDTDAEAFALAVSTPGEPQGRFYDIHRRAVGYEDWYTRHVTLDEAIAAGRVSREWTEQRERQWGKDSAVYQNRVLGEFATAQARGVIPLSWVEAANERWYAWVEEGQPGVLTGIGVDVGGGLPGGDKTVLAPCFDRFRIGELRKHGQGDPDVATMETVARVAGLLKKHGTGEAVVDVIGIGAGVVHRLREMGYRARAFNAGKGTALLDRSGELGFANWRAAAWWITRELLDPGEGVGVALPPDDDLTGELTAPRYKLASGGRARGGLIQIEDKLSVRRRLKRSTDCADAVVQALVGPVLCDEATQATTEEIVWQPARIGPRI